MRVLVVAPIAPPYGGMALQAQQLQALLRRDGVHVALLASNFALPFPLGFAERVPVVRAAIRAALVWFKLWTKVREADVVHVFAASWLYFFVVVYPAVLVGRARGRRVVVNYRGGEASSFFRRYGWLAAKCFRSAGVITAPSEFLAAAIRERFDVPVSIVPNILDTSLFSYRRRTAIRPRLLVTRHLEKIYDTETVLKAFRSVQSRYPDASLWIAGGGSEEARLRGLVSEWNLPGVRFLGEIAHRDLPSVYGECDIYVNASRVDNFPGALLEASAAGLVVVTTRAGGIPFIYDHGKTASMVDPGDWEALSDAIIKVLQNPSQGVQMTEAALAIVRACEWTEVRKRLFEAYGFGNETGSTGPASLNGARCVAG